ncbi:restriction endonuclease subunit S [Paenibacillus polymyxa]|uniref:restriction endonuclease subunit S n=1 Tax=Paenibacillus polymyxa TaxID=1406 RepID=UPI002ED3B199|nr:restriction endonuclease subunit S [Paenibacillus polymyxa]
MSEHKENVPKIRFPGFTDAWEQRRLGEVTTKIGSGKTPIGGNSSYVSEGVSLIRSQNIYDDFVHLDDVVFISNEIDEEMKNSRVIKNDVLLNITGASIGRSAVYKLSDKANVNQHVCIIRPDNSVEADFIQLNISSSKGQKEIELNQAGGGREGLNFQQISKMSFFYPLKQEQQVIGRFFKQLDHLITLHQRKLNNVKNLKAGLFQKMFPKNGEDFPEVRFPGFTDAWEQRKVIDIAPLQRGFDLPVSEMEAGSYPVIMSNGVGAYHSKYKARAPGVVTGRSGTIGNLTFVETDYWPHNTALWVTDFKGNDAKFIYYLYQKLDLKRYGTGSGVPTLNRNNVHDTKTNIPSVTEQNQISRLFESLDHLITLHQRKLKHLQEQKKTLLQQMFI